MSTIDLLDTIHHEDEVASSIADEPEPRVLTKDVSSILKRVVRPNDDDAGESVKLIAEKAETSTRTVYRVLSVSTETISLDLADRLCIAASAHISACRLSWPDGSTTPYF